MDKADKREIFEKLKYYVGELKEISEELKTVPITKLGGISVGQVYMGRYYCLLSDGNRYCLSGGIRDGKFEINISDDIKECIRNNTGENPRVLSYKKVG